MPRVVVVGAGVVGTATGVVLSEHGHTVSFVDPSPDARRRLSQGGYDAIHPDSINLDDVEVIFVSVPTPSRNQTGLDYTYLKEASRTIGTALRRRNRGPRPVIVFRSTMLPGSTSNQLVPIIEQASAMNAGTGFGVCYMPEYLREKSSVEDFRSLKLVVLGCDPDDESLQQTMRVLFAGFNAEFHILSIAAAEFQKYVHNLFNAVKISFFNEMRMIAEVLGINGDTEPALMLTAQSAEGLTRPTYGVENLGPYGGACLPKDMAAMLHFLAERGIMAPVLNGADQTNNLVAKQNGNSLLTDEGVS